MHDNLVFTIFFSFATLRMEHKFAFQTIAKLNFQTVFFVCVCFELFNDRFLWCSSKNDGK
jgi:hypothetical protein